MKTLTWKNTFEIIEKTLDLNQKEVSKHLGVNAGTISKIKNDETGRFTSWKSDQIYARLFAPCNKEIPATQNNEKTLLEILKDVVKNFGFQDVMYGLWDKEYEDGDYKKFVIALLERTQSNPTVKRKASITKSKISINDNTLSTPEPPPQIDPPPLIFSDYVTALEKHYKTTTTLLHTSQSVQFSDFYVRSKFSDLPKEETRVDKEEMSLKEFTDSYKLAIFTGGSGIGKSMFMRDILLKATSKFDDLQILPIFVSLKDYSESAGSLIEQILSTIKVYICITEEQLIAKLQAGKCLLLFDGLDEMKKSDEKQFRKEVINLTKTYRENNNFYISSRPDNDFRQYDCFVSVPILPFTKDQALELINKIEACPVAKSKFCALLEKQLFETHREFVENPLLLTLMFMVFAEKGKVHSKKHIFYNKAFEILAKRRCDGKGFETGLNIDEIKTYLAEICFHAYLDEQYDFTPDEFPPYFEKLPKSDKTVSARDFLDDMCNGIGIMKFDEYRYSFTHRLFQEYFVAVFISKQSDEFIGKLGDFFEKRLYCAFTDSILSMLYDIIPRKVERFIFLPFLQDLFDLCDKGSLVSPYQTFLRQVFVGFFYNSDEEFEWIETQTKSTIYRAIRRNVLELSVAAMGDLSHIEFDKKSNKYTINPNINNEPITIDSTDSDDDFGEEEYYEFWNEIDRFDEDENFPLKREYNVARKYFGDIKKRSDNEFNLLFGKQEKN